MGRTWQLSAMSSTWRHSQQPGAIQLFELITNTYLEEGKPKKVALVACMRKLLTILNAMIRTMEPWEPVLAAPRSPVLATFITVATVLCYKFLFNTINNCYNKKFTPSRCFCILAQVSTREMVRLKTFRCSGLERHNQRRNSHDA